MSEINENGNTVERGFALNRERYFYDSGKGLPGEGWKQFETNQDASYFGVWINFDTWQSFSFCEGDTTLTTCEDIEHFRLELADLVEFHGAPPASLRSIDADGTYHEHILERPSIDNPKPKSHSETLLELLSG